MTHTENRPDRLRLIEMSPEELLRHELNLICERMEKYRQLAHLADRVVITVVCCDSREHFPPVLVPVQAADRQGGQITQQVLYLQIPTIGSGAPSHSRLRGIREVLLHEWKIPANKIDICVTQHANAQELAQFHDPQGCESQDRIITCGLRKFFYQHRFELKKINELLTSWAYLYKVEEGDPKLAPDRLSLELLRKEAPEIMELVDELHEKSGEVGFRLPRRLIIRAAYRNSDFDLDGNLNGILEKIRGYLWNDEWAKVRPTCRVMRAEYDHDTKELEYDDPYAGPGVVQKLKLPHLKERSVTYQDPEYGVISFGREVVPYSIDFLLPLMCGLGAQEIRGMTDNAFNTVASIPRVETLLAALAEIMYAVLHRVRPHHGDQNFRHLKRVVILCDNQEYVDIVHQMLRSAEYIEEYQPMLRELHDNLLVVNLNLKAERKPEMLEIPVAA